MDRIVKDIIEQFVVIFNKTDNKNKLENNIINPILCNIKYKLYPYFILISIMYGINILLIVIILILLYRTNYNIN